MEAVAESDGGVYLKFNNAATLNSYDDILTS